MEKKTIDCPARKTINEYCSCPKTECENHGLCCKCIVKHKKRDTDKYEVKFPHCLRDLLKEALEQDKALP